MPSERLFASSRAQDHIQGSPFRLFTAAAPADARASSFAVDGPRALVAGESTAVSVQLRDARGNPVAELQDPARWVPPPPPPRTKWTRRVPHPVLIGHAASLTPY